MKFNLEAREKKPQNNKENNMETQARRGPENQFTFYDQTQKDLSNLTCVKRTLA